MPGCEAGPGRKATALCSTPSARRRGVGRTAETRVLCEESETSVLGWKYASAGESVWLWGETRGGVAVRGPACCILLRVV